MDDDEPAAVFGECGDPLAFFGFEVAPTLAVDDDDVGLSQLFGCREGFTARRARTVVNQEWYPIAEKGGVIVIAGFMRLGAGANKDAQLLRWNALDFGWSWGVGRKDGRDGEQG
jgi:hypothetical protein